jgi:hypothetical protein
MTTIDATVTTGQETTSGAIAAEIQAQADSAARLEEVLATAKARIGAAQSRLANLLADQALGRELPGGEPRQAEQELERAKLTLQGLEADRARSAEVAEVLEARRRAATDDELQAEQEALARRFVKQAARLKTAAGEVAAAGRELDSLYRQDVDIAHRRAAVLGQTEFGSWRSYRRIQMRLDRLFTPSELDRLVEVAAMQELVGDAPESPEGDAA